MKLALLILFILISNADACPLLQKVNDSTLTFKQTKHILGIKMPIISSGNFILSTGKQVIWETLKPFYSKVIISEQGFQVQDELYSAGPLKQISSILLQLHSGNLKLLEDRFSFKCEKQDDNKFHLIALPKQTDLLKVFKEVEIIGTSFPEKINYTDARGDKTNVEFQ